MATKAELRREARARLHGMSPEGRGARGALIAEAVWSVPGLATVRRVLLYASMAEEVPTPAIARGARERGIEVAYPKCAPDSEVMTLHLTLGEDALRGPGRFGVPEPDPTCPEVPLSTIDAVFLPGLGWDRWGRRLGRGAGYYDRLLSDPDWRGLRIGLFFAEQEFPDLPVDDWDVPLDFIVSDTEIVQAGERS